MHSMNSFCITQVINYWSSISLNTAHQSYSSIYKVMQSFAFNVGMSEKLHNYGHGYLHACSIRVYPTALLEFIPDCAIRVYRSFQQVLKRAHVTSVNPSLRDECKFYQLLCCSITLYCSLILSCHTKWCVRILLAEV